MLQGINEMIPKEFSGSCEAWTIDDFIWQTSKENEFLNLYSPRIDKKLLEWQKLTHNSKNAESSQGQSSIQKIYDYWNTEIAYRFNFE